VAAEQIGRRAYCLELDPAYADVCIRRWQTITKRDAILDGTDQTFEELSALPSKSGAKAASHAPQTTSSTGKSNLRGLGGEVGRSSRQRRKR